jgi:lipoprotein-releasing system permease protein
LINILLSLRIAVRFLRSNPWQTALITCGMAVAVSIQVFVGLLIGSLQSSLVESTVRNSPQVTISSGTGVASIFDWDKIIDTVQRTGLVTAASPVTAGSATTVKDAKTIPLLLKGVHVEEADRIYGLKDAIYAGDLYVGSRDALIGRQLADELRVGVGDRLTVMLPNGNETIFNISGLYDLGAAAVNKTWVIANMRTVQQLLGLPGRITSIEVSVPDVFSADGVAGQLGRELDNGNLKIDNWKDQNKELMGALRSQGMSSAIIQVVIVFSVVIAISSVLAITVLQKSRQIGILKAMGIRDLSASMIFIFEGLLVGLAGSLLGVGLGLGLLYGFDSFSSGPGAGNTIKITIDYGFILLSWAIAVAASTLAGLLAARRSLKLNPIDIIREG